MTYVHKERPTIADAQYEEFNTDMILTKDTQSQHLIATITQGDTTQQYTCQMSSCPNPVCQCGDVTLSLTVRADHEGGRESVLPTTVKLHVTQDVFSGQPSPPSHERHDVSILFLSQLQEDDYHLLYAEYLTQKRSVTDHTDLHEIDAPFPMQDIEREGLLITYNDILPYGKRFQIVINHHRYLVLDQYCVRTTCPCTDIILSYFSCDVSIAPEHELGSMSLNYRKRIWNDVHERGAMENGLTPNIFKKTLEQTFPSFYQDLKHRHHTLKVLYANSRKHQRLPQEPVVTRKVGRNDPCPCGSGKKFKKCCLNRQDAS